MSALPVHKERIVAAPPEAVFAMFTEPDQLARWLGATTGLDPRPGGAFGFTIESGHACRGEYVEVTPYGRVAFTWGWEDVEAMPVPVGSTLVEVTLEPHPDGTLLRLTHSGLGPDGRLLHADGWDRFLQRLVAAASGQTAGPDPSAESPQEALDRLQGR